MPDLDSRLREILWDVHHDFKHESNPNVNNQDVGKAVQKIKQAFADELHIMLNRPEFRGGLLTAARQDGLMTGPEWHRALIKHLSDEDINLDHEDDVLEVRDVLKASKRAAGIE